MTNYEVGDLPTVDVAGVDLPVFGDHVPDDFRHLVPESDFIVTPSVEKWLSTIARYVKAGMAVMAWGEPGTGKTAAFQYIAAMQQRPFVVVQMHRTSEPGDVLGTPSLVNEDGVTVTSFDPTEMMAAVTGSPALAVFDEYPAAPHEARQAARPLLEGRDSVPLSTWDGRPVTLHRDSTMGATGNPPWSPRNVGVGQLDEADNSRLIHVHVPYSDGPAELAIMGRAGSGSVDDAALILGVMRRLRESNFPLACGTRAVLTAWRAVDAGVKPLHALFNVFSYESDRLWKGEVAKAVDECIDAEGNYDVLLGDGGQAAALAWGGDNEVTLVKGSVDPTTGEEYDPSDVLGF